MADFVNTVEIVEDSALFASIIHGTITEFKDNVITTVGYGAFTDCTMLTDIAFPNVTTLQGGAFRGCTALKEITPEMFPKVTKLAYMYNNGIFAECTALESVRWDALVEDLSSNLFGGCSNLKSVDMPNYVGCTSYGGETFSNCKALVSVNLPKLGIVSGSMFSYCDALKSLTLPSVYKVGWGGCNYVTGLETVDLPVCSEIVNSGFAESKKLTAVILRKSDAAATLAHTNAFSNTPIQSGTGYIYVPSALVDSYKAASNWSTYAAQFRALEDYTVDGTITGELDETKI